MDIYINKDKSLHILKKLKNIIYNKCFKNYFLKYMS